METTRSVNASHHRRTSSHHRRRYSLAGKHFPRTRTRYLHGHRWSCRATGWLATRPVSPPMKNTDIPPWGKYMMMIASALGTFLLARDLMAQGWPNPIG